MILRYPSSFAASSGRTLNINLQYKKTKGVGAIGKITGGLLLALALAGCVHSISKNT